MTTSVSLDADLYNNFLRCLTNLKEVCNDVEIRDGFIRQRSNDKTSVFEIDMTSLLPGISFAISDLKINLDLFKLLAGQSVTIEIGESTYTLNDGLSSYSFKSPSLQYLDNKFISEEDLNRIFVIDEDNLILEKELSTTLTGRIRVTSAIYSTDAIQIIFNGETASIKGGTQAKDKFVNFIMDNMVTNMILTNCSALLSTVPFSIDHDNKIMFKMFKDQSQDIALNQFQAAMGDINMRIFTRSSIVANEE